MPGRWSAVTASRSPANSIMGLMMLAAALGTSIDVRVEGAEAEPLAEALKALVQGRFGEPT